MAQVPENLLDPNTPATARPIDPATSSAPAGSAAAPVPVDMPEPELPDDMDANHLQRIQKAQTWHSPVEAKIRDYEQRARTVKEAENKAAGGVPAGGDQGTSKGSEGSPASPEAQKPEEIVEGELTYTVEPRPDGYYITQTKDQQGKITPYEGGIYLGKDAPKGTEKGFMDKLRDVTAKDVATGAANAVGGAFVGMDIGLMKLATNAVRTLVDNPIGKFYVGEDNVEAFNTFSNWLSTNLDKAKDEIFKDSSAGKVGAFVGQAGGQFVGPAMGAYSGLRALGANPLVAAALGDVGVAIFGVNPDDPNLSNLLPEDGRLKPFRDIMATDPSDPSWKNRARNATEALVTLGVAEVGAKTIVQAVGKANQFVREQQLPEKFMEQLDRFIQDETGSLTLPGGKKSADLPQGPQRPEVLQKAIDMLGPVQPGKPIVTDDAIAQVRAAVDKSEFVGFGHQALEGIDFNFARMEKPEEIGDVINKLSELYAEPTYKAKRGVQSFDMTKAKADLEREMGFDVGTILNRKTGEVWNAEKLLAARDIFHAEAEKTVALGKAIKLPGGNSQEALVAFRRQVAVLAAVQMQVKGARTETARALAANRITAKSPLESSRQIREMLDQTGGHEVNEQFVDAFLNLANSGGDSSAIARFARAQVTTPDMLYEAWINSLLGSPKTHIVNISGNALATAQGVVERYGAAAYGAGERTVLKMMGKQATPGGIHFSEANAYARGMAFGIWDALRAAGKAMKTGQGQDMFNKLGYGDKITAQNINELPIAKSIAGRLGKDELLSTNSTLALFADRLGEFYFRLPGRFLMAEDEFFKTLNYRAELNAQASREAMSLNYSPAQAAARRAEIFEDPQLAAPNVHLGSIDNAREFTFTQQAGEFAGKFQETLNAAKIGDVPVGRVVIPFFNVINNITKFVGSRTPGFALLNPRSQTYRDLFSGDPAKRQLVMGKWATGGAIAGWAAWMNQNGVCTGRLSDNPRVRKQMELQGKKPYSCQVTLPDGTVKAAQYNRLEPIGMIFGIASTTSEVMNYVDSEEDRQNLVIAATSAILPYLEDKSFFKGAVDFANALFPQYGEDNARAKALGDYFIGLGGSAAGAVLGPAAPGTPLSRWARQEIAGDEVVRSSKPNPYRIVKDKDGDDILVPNDEFGYRTWEGIIKKVMDATPGLSEKLPPRPNLWGEDVVMENGVFSASAFSPITSSTIKYDVKKLEGSNLPDQMKNGYFNGMMIGRDISLGQFKTFIDIAGIDGELERLGSPVPMPSKEIAAKNGAKNIGLPVKMNDEQYYKYMQILNKISVPNDADPERKSMNLREMLDWTVRQPVYATLPEDGDAKQAKADILKQVVKKYRTAADNLFFEQPENKPLRQRSITLQIQAQQTGASQ